MAYAKGTKVNTLKTRIEIEQLVLKHGATAFNYAANSEKAMIQFECRDRVIRFMLPLLPIEKFAKKKHRAGYLVQRSSAEQSDAHEQNCRERWRALLLAIKAKLESVDSGIEQFEEAFMAQVVNPGDNRTLYESLQEQIKISYSGGHQQLRLPSPESFAEADN